MIETWVISFSLILARTGTFVAVLPLFGGRTVPRLVKVGLAFSLAVMWFGSFGPASSSSPAVSLTASHWLGLAVAMVRECALGAVLGYAFGLFLVPARIAGEFIGQEMGLAMASLSDPMADNSAGLVGQIFEMLGVLVFLGLDGHHVFLAALDSTFVRWPVGETLATLPIMPMVSGAAAAQEWGLLIAAPVAACLFITSVVLTLMARAAPQLNILSVGFSLRLIVGLVAALLLMPEMITAMTSVFGHFGEFLRGLV